MVQLEGLVDAGNTVIVVEHDMYVVSSSDWVIDIGPGAGDDGGKVIASGPPDDIVKVKDSKTAFYLAREIGFSSTLIHESHRFLPFFDE